MYHIEQRADGWWVIMVEGHQAVQAWFSDRGTAQLIAATLPALPQGHARPTAATRKPLVHAS